MTSLRHSLAISLALALPFAFGACLLLSPSAAGAASVDAPVASVVRLQRIGHPAWKPADFHLFSAPIGTADDGYAEFSTTSLAVLPPPNHVANPSLGVGPGAPHAPPYTSEMAEGLANLNYHEGTHFAPTEFSAGQAVWLTYMVVPTDTATTGSSPDFASGPIIPNTLFPIHVSATDMHGGRQYSVVADVDVPALDAYLDPPFFVDGHSHFPMYLADNSDFGDPSVPLKGGFAYDVTMTDVQGNGWHFVVRFTLAP